MECLDLIPGLAKHKTVKTQACAHMHIHKNLKRSTGKPLVPLPFFPVQTLGGFFFWQLESAHVSADIRSHSQTLSSHLGWPPLLRLLRQEAWASAVVYSTRLSFTASRVLFRVNDPLFFLLSSVQKSAASSLVFLPLASCLVS